MKKSFFKKSIDKIINVVYTDRVVSRSSYTVGGYRDCIKSCRVILSYHGVLSYLVHSYLSGSLIPQCITGIPIPWLTPKC
jgi:hypothetical protein